MSTTPVVIKGMRSGIVVVLDNDMEFDLLKEEIINKFESSKAFLGAADIAISFEGRTLSNDEITEVVSIISEHSDLNVICVIDDDENKNQVFENALDNVFLNQQQKADLNDKKYGYFYKGNLRSGQSITSDSGAIIIGDVNAGANVIAKGNIIIIGTLLGTVHAGCDGDTNAFVIALDMRPTQIRIGELIARSADKKTSKLLPVRKKPEIAYISANNIYIEEISREVLNDIEI